jgi:hypothetical protein
MAIKHCSTPVMIIFATLVVAAADEPVQDAKPDQYADFSRLIHQMVVKQMPKVYEDDSSWGKTIPLTEPLRLPGLRTYIKKGDKVELPHGLWKKVRVWMNDPDKDLRIQVKDFKKLDAKTFRLVVDSESDVRSQIDAQHWQKGLALAGFAGKADLTVAISMDCDVGVSLTSNFELKIDPKITRLNMDLKDVLLREVSTPRLGVVLEGEKAKEFGGQFKEILQIAAKSAEPKVKDLANQAIAKSIREGKGTLGAAHLLKLLGNGEKAKK